MRGNDARFINHGCDPNLEVRKYQTLGDGLEEFEIGMWALRDIKEGEEVRPSSLSSRQPPNNQLFYNYNFDWFGEAKNSLSAQCRCGAPNCIGVLGRKNDRQSAALEVELKKAAEEARNAAKSQRGRKAGKKIARKTTVKFTGAVERAKQAVVARSTKASAKAAAGANDILSDSQDHSGEGYGQDTAQILSDEVNATIVAEQAATPESEEIEMQESEADWVDMTMDIDAAEDMYEASDSSRDGSFLAQQPEIEVAGESSSRPHGVTDAPLPSFNRSSSLPLHLDDSAAPAQRDPSKTIPRSALINPPSPSQRPYPNDRVASSSTQHSALHSSSPADLFTSEPQDGTPSTRPQTKAEIAAAKRKSGWANWLRKIASEKPRTLEEWHEERMKRRRGIAWMNMMIAEFGVAPSSGPVTSEAYSDGRKPAGSVGSFANTLAAQGHGPGPEGVRNLGGPKNAYRSDNWKKTKEQQLKYVRMNTGSETPAPETPGRAIVDSPSFGSTSNPNGPISSTSARSDDMVQDESNKRQRTGTSPLIALPSSASGSMAHPANARTSTSPNTFRSNALHYERDQAYSRSHHDGPSSPEQHMRPYTQPSHIAAPAGSRPVPSKGAPEGRTLGQHSVAAHASKGPDNLERSINSLIPSAFAVSTTYTSASVSLGPVADSSEQREAPQPAKRPYWRVAPNTPPPRTEQKTVSVAKTAEHPRTVASPAAPTPSAAQELNNTPSETPVRGMRAMPLAAPRSVPSSFAPNGPAETSFTMKPLDFSSENEPTVSRSSSHQGQTLSLKVMHPPPASRVADAPAPPAPSASPAPRGPTAKKQAIQKRNGAPMGWVYTYEPVQSTATRMGEETIATDLPRSARRARQSLA